MRGAGVLVSRPDPGADIGFERLHALTVCTPRRIMSARGPEGLHHQPAGLPGRHPGHRRVRDRLPPPVLSDREIIPDDQKRPAGPAHLPPHPRLDRSAPDHRVRRPRCQPLRICSGFSRGGRPGTGFASSAPCPPSVSGQPPADRRAVQARSLRHVLRAGARLNLVHRTHPQNFQGFVIKLAAVVLAHSQLSQITRSNVDLLTNYLVIL